MTVLFRWWRFAQAVVLGVSTPAADVSQSDRVFEAQLRESAAFRTLHGAADSFGRAAATSRMAGVIGTARHEWRTAAREARIGTVGLVVSVASATALILSVVRPAGVDPFVVVVPSLALMAGLVALTLRRLIAGVLNRLDS